MNLKALALKYVMAKLESQMTDKGELSYEGELAVGVEVFIPGEDGEPQAAPDGEYKTEDGMIIVVEEGKVAEIREPEQPVAEEPEIIAEPAELAAHKAMKVAADESYDEIMRKIAEAVGGDAFVVEAGDGWAVVNEWNAEEEKEHFYRYAISIDAEGNISLGDKVEVFPRFVTEEEASNLQFETEEEIAAIKAENEALKAENEALKAKIEELEAAAAAPAQEPASVAASKQERKKGRVYFELMN